MKGIPCRGSEEAACGFQQPVWSMFSETIVFKSTAKVISSGWQKELGLLPQDRAKLRCFLAATVLGNNCSVHKKLAV